MSVFESGPTKGVDEEKRKWIDGLVQQLLEHFDSVSIFVTHQDGGSDATSSYDSGGGNYYARLGQIQEWLCIHKQYQRNWAIRKDRREQDEEEDGDD